MKKIKNFMFNNETFLWPILRSVSLLSLTALFLFIFFTNMYPSEIMVGIIFLFLVPIGVWLFLTWRKSFIFLFYLLIGVGMFTLSTLALSKLCLLGIAWSIGLIVILHISFNFHLSKINISSVILNTFIWGRFIRGLSNYKILLSNPFFIENLSSFSYYRYSFLFLLSIPILIIWMIHIFVKYVKAVSIKIPELPWYIDLSKISEESIFIFLGKFETFDLYSWSFVQSLFDRKKLKKVLIIHFIFFQGLSLIYLIFFYKFIFFHGDLRYIFILLPLTTLKYILSLWEAYLKKRFEMYCEEIRSLFVVTVRGKDKKELEEYISIPPSELLFEWTPLAISKGFISKEALAKDWLDAAYLSAAYARYKEKIYIIAQIRFIFQVFAWGGIITYFYLMLPSEDLAPAQLNLFSIFKRAGNLLSSAVSPRLPPLHSPSQISQPSTIILQKNSYATQHYKDVEKTTSGDYKAGHTILSDSELEKEGKLPFWGQPTHGEGNPANPSVCLHSSRDFNGENSRGQRAVFPQTTPPPEVEKKWHPIPGSKEFMAEPEVKANMDKAAAHRHAKEQNDPKTTNTTNFES